jgi:hypothetical protein
MRFALQLAVVLTLSFSASAVAPAWVQLAQLTASDGQPLDAFGESVSISGNTIVVGSFGAGAAYVFVKPQNGWTDMTQVAKLTASDGNSQDQFGISAAINGNTIVVGAPCATVNGNSCQGAGYVFVKPSSGWANMTETAKLTASDGQAADQLGVGAINGNTIALAAPLKTVNGVIYAGEVYVYEKPSSGWVSSMETAKFSEGGNNQGHGGIEFGNSVALGGVTLIVGAPSFYVGSLNRGVVFVYVKAPGGWKKTTRTSVLEDSKSGRYFGSIVGISNDGGTVVGGLENSPKPGKALIFVKPANGWPIGPMTETATLTDGTGSADEFGSAVGISGSTVIAGAWNPGNLGAAYVFAKPANGWKTTHKYQEKLMTSGETADWSFAGIVAISGSTAVVSANGWSDGKGAAFVFGKE